MTERTPEQELDRLQWVERQVAEQVKDWMASAGGVPSQYERALLDCAQEITGIIESSFAPGYGLKPMDHAAELKRHADALVSEIEAARLLRDLADAANLTRATAEGMSALRGESGIVLAGSQAAALGLPPGARLLLRVEVAGT